MAATLLWGKPVAEEIYAELRERLQRLALRGVIPGLAVVRVGEAPASSAYTRQEEGAAQRLGVRVHTHALPSDASEQEVLDLIARLNKAPEVHGILVHQPLPPHISAVRVSEALDPRKDVEGLHPWNMGRLLLGEPYLVPCTAHAVWQLLVRSGYPPEGKHVVVCGRSNTVGKPLAALLLQKKPGANATITVCHTGTPDLARFTRQADILVVAVGAPRTVTADMVREGAVVVDVGVNHVADPTTRTGFRLVGDTDFEALREKVEAITPVPGGVGPVTVAMLLWNVVAACEAQLGLPREP